MPTKKYNMRLGSCAMLAVIIVTLLYFSAYAAEGTVTAVIDNQSRMLSISCGVPSGKKDVFVALTIKFPENTVQKIKYAQVDQSITGADGKASFDMELDSESPSGTYTVEAFSEGQLMNTEFTFTNIGDISIINNAQSADDICKAVEDNAKRFGMDLTDYNALPQDINRKNVGNYLLNIRGSGFDIVGLKNEFALAVAFEWIVLSKTDDTDENSLISILDKYSNILTVSVLGDKTNQSDSDYDKLTVNAKAYFKSAIAGNRFANLQKFTDTYKESLIVGFFKNAYWPQILDYSKFNSSDILSLDLGTNYKSLNDKSIPFKKVIEDMSSLSGASDISADFNAAVLTALNNQNSSKGKASSTGGGGSRSSVSASTGYVANPPQSPIADNEPKELFNDLSGVPWAKEAIVSLAQEGILNGDGSGRFEPEANVTREQFVKMIVKAFKLEGNKKEIEFNDIKEDSWYYECVSIAISNNIINGMGDGTFGVGNSVTRQDIAVIAFRVLSLKDISVKDDVCIAEYKDSQNIAEYSRSAVTMLSNAGILNGTDEGVFNPQGNATKAEAAKLIYSLEKLID